MDTREGSRDGWAARHTSWTWASSCMLLHAARVVSGTPANNQWTGAADEGAGLRRRRRSRLVVVNCCCVSRRTGAWLREQNVGFSSSPPPWLRLQGFSRSRRRADCRTANGRVCGRGAFEETETERGSSLGAAGLAASPPRECQCPAGPGRRGGASGAVNHLRESGSS